MRKIIFRYRIVPYNLWDPHFRKKTLMDDKQNLKITQTIKLFSRSLRLISYVHTHTIYTDLYEGIADNKHLSVLVWLFYLLLFVLFYFFWPDVG